MFGNNNDKINRILQMNITDGNWIRAMDIKLDSIIHDLQQIKTSQRASQKRERKTIKKVTKL